MAPSYQDYLAAEILSENRMVNYRLLSRALGIHVNLAKEMLYDFHHTQCARKSASVHATYLLTGVRKAPPAPNGANAQHDDDDAVMTDSFAASSAPDASQDEFEHTPVTTITLCREEDLSSVQSSYTSLHSIHIYSLEPGPLANIYNLTECNLRAAAAAHGQDPLESWKAYGTIHNAKAQRRSTRAPPPAKPSVPAPSKPVSRPAPAAAPPKSATETTTSTPDPADSKQADPARPAPKRESSSLFKSFQKQASKPKKPTADTPMQDAPDEGSDSESPAQAPDPQAQARAEAARKEKADRDAKLKAMMEEESDEEMKDDDPDDEPEPEPQPEPEPEPETKQPSPEPEATVSVSNGRRRGRRRVTKKKTTRDAEGYLVTREEAVWESFSEDDAPAKSVSKPKNETDAEPAAKPSKPAATAKKGQGNIMSFFGKK